MLLKFKTGLWVVLFLGMLTPLSAQEKVAMQNSRNGGEFQYPKGNTDVKFQTLLLDRGKPMPWHYHPVPTFAYSESEILEVETKQGRSKQFRTGESLIEVMNPVIEGWGFIHWVN